jgi:plastocyanin
MCKKIIVVLFLTATLAMQGNGYYENHHENSLADTSATERVVELRTEGSDLSYDVTEIKAKAGEKLTIRYINASEMYHNVVVVKNEDDIKPVGIAALQAYKNDYIPEGEMDRIVAYSKMADAGETVEFTFTVPPPGTYPYICTYSGHFTSMQGRLISSN